MDIFVCIPYIGFENYTSFHTMKKKHNMIERPAQPVYERYEHIRRRRSSRFKRTMLLSQTCSCHDHDWIFTFHFVTFVVVCVFFIMEMDQCHLRSYPCNVNMYKVYFVSFWYCRMK